MELGLIVSPEHDLDMYWYLLVLYFCVAQVLLAVEENKKSRPPGNLLYPRHIPEGLGMRHLLAFFSLSCCSMLMFSLSAERKH